MKVRARAVAWLLPLLLTGCSHIHWRPHQNLAPIAPAVNSTLVLPPPVATARPKVELAPLQPTTSPTAPATIPKPKPGVKRPRPVKAKAEQAAKLAAPTPPVPQPVAPASVSVSAIGLLTSDDSVELRRQTTNEIADLERRLSGIEGKLYGQDRKTTAQIREYLKQAKTALASGDVDGAHTLTAKARLLFSELSQ